MVCRAISAMFFGLALYLYKLPDNENADTKLSFDACSIGSSDNKVFELTEDDDLDQSSNGDVLTACQEATRF